MIGLLYEKLENYASCPTAEEWLAKRGRWGELKPKVGAMIKTSTTFKDQVAKHKDSFILGIESFTLYIHNSS